jgi:hypothetical protein
MSFIDEVEELAAAQTKKEKILLLQNMSDIAFTFVTAAIDPFQIWFVSDVPREAELTECGELDSDSAMIAFLQILEELKTGELRGNAASDLLTSFWAELTESDREWFGRVLRKKMRIGVGVSTVNAARPGSIREFDLPLCDSLEAVITDSSIEWRGKIKPELPCYADVKLDGLRVLCVRRTADSEWELFTRGGDLIETMSGAQAALLSFIPKDLGGVILHAEGYGTSWSDSASSIMAKKRSKLQNDPGKPLWIFDIVALDEFSGDVLPTTPFVSRRNLLVSLFSRGSVSEFLKLMPSYYVTNDKEIIDAFNDALKFGEGLVLKKKSSVPHLGRSQDWLKLKPLRTWEGVIVETFTGKNGTRLEGLFAGFKIRLPESGAITEVGSGFTDAQRQQYTAILKKDPRALDGRWIEVEGQPPLTDDGRIRFPVFSRERSARDLG